MFWTHCLILILIRRRALVRTLGVNEGVDVEIFYNGHGRHLLFVLVLFLDHVFFGIRARCTSPIRSVAAVSGLHLCGVPGSSFREHLSILAG